MDDADRVGVEELQEHASRYVEMAKAGRRVPVTEDGKLVAYLVPADQPRSVYEQLVAAGKVRPATGSLLDLPPLPRAEPDEPSLSDTAIQMRNEERY